ncbi:FHA domain-containing protein [Tepidicella xavieri]|uniref:FHA domain-containing protein n=1 Tax=Tepidicella xavieri TaxID=360241 RepID=A0A4R6U309_9BURK|nr:FHA domain-containing protein [Tepidicella xavieri]TDQ37494.1 FHA domain-containing protein [Tepidicella xavieri]
MPTLTISLDGVDLKSIELTQPRTTLGRRPYNDIVMDHLAVSGEHAVFVQKPQGLELIDLNSTNGTYVNGKAIVATVLQPGDLIEIGRYKMRVTWDDAAPSAPPAAAPTAPDAPAPATEPAAPAAPAARIRVLSGPAAGREMPLTKAVTTLGKPGVAVAAIHHGADGHYTLRLIDGNTPPLVNGQPVGKEPAALHGNDVITLAGTQMQFLA